MTQPQEFPGAVRGGDIGALRRFVREQPALANTRDPSGVSAVMLAMYHGMRTRRGSWPRWVLR
ncbi:MAG: hypothetical protein NTY23_06745 [Chloroflexi bacterium]|nr:hypothetical protein [Chloroflexota bacterium]